MCEGDTIQPNVIEDLLPSSRPKPAPAAAARPTPPAKSPKKAVARKR
jgi:hypothetical protein